jgi:hypothetical protein
VLGLDTNKQMNISPVNVPQRDISGVDNWKIVKLHGWRMRLAFKIEAILKEIGRQRGDISLVKRASKMGICANTLKVKREISTSRFYVSGIRCHDRVCPVCNAFRAGKLAKKVDGLMEKMNNPHFLTLTFGERVNTAVLNNSLNEFTEKLKKLRRTKWWNESILGGIFFNEVTFKKGIGWHIHSHMIVDLKTDKKIFNLQGGYGDVSVTDFKKKLELTCVKEGLGRISSINPCQIGTGRELSKYFYKVGLDFDRENNEAIAEMIIAFKNRRIYGTFGNCRNIKAQDVEDEEADDELDDELETEEEFEDFGTINDVVIAWHTERSKYNSIIQMLIIQGFIELESLDYFFEKGEKTKFH